MGVRRVSKDRRLKSRGFLHMLWILAIACGTYGCSSNSNGQDKGGQVPVQSVQTVEIQKKTDSTCSENRETSLSFKSNQSNTELSQSSPRPLPIKPVKVRGIYVSGPVASSAKSMDRLIALLGNTSLNTMVIDVKTDAGYLTYDSKVEMVDRIGADRYRKTDEMAGIIRRLKNKHIYTIARIAVFKDPHLANSLPQYAIRNKSGGIWRDSKEIAWSDPYKSEVWDYNLAIAKEAAALGFDEIQFDYVRFPENGKKTDSEVAYDNPDKRSKSETISQFLSKARPVLHEQGAWVSADVFGLTTSISPKDDMGIGQEWDKIAANVDYISPMLYPSHYSKGMYGIRHPDLEPYQVIHKAIIDAKAKNTQMKTAALNPAQIRPWFQAFTATWVKPHRNYGVQEIMQQAKAASELGIDEYLLWNSRCVYYFKK